MSLIPYILYALITNSLSDFLHAYIKFNKIYAATDNRSIWSLLVSAFQNITNIAYSSKSLIFIIIFFGLLYFLYCYKEDFILNISIFISCISFLIIASVVAFGYNFIILGVFSIFGYIAFYDIGKNIIKKFSKENNRSIKVHDMLILVFTICFIFACTITNNKCIFINLKKIDQINLQKSCQKQVADIILSNSDKDHSLLDVLSLDNGFYTALNSVPKSKYFYMPNILFDKYPNVYLGQYEDICNKLNKYVITSFESHYKADIDKQDINSQNYVDKISCAIAKNYELIDTINGTYAQSGRVFYLYKQI